MTCREICGKSSQWKTNVTCKDTVADREFQSARNATAGETWSAYDVLHHTEISVTILLLHPRTKLEAVCYNQHRRSDISLTSLCFHQKFCLPWNLSPGNTSFTLVSYTFNTSVIPFYIFYSSEPYNRNLSVMNFIKKTKRSVQVVSNCHTYLISSLLKIRIFVRQ